MRGIDQTKNLFELKDRKVSELVNEVQRIMYKLPKLCDKIKGCSDRNCRMSTFEDSKRWTGRELD